MPRYKTTFPVIAGITLSTLLSAKAQEATSEAPPILLPEVTVIGSEEAALNLPGSGAYIDVEDLRKYNVSDVNRALRQVPGVYVREEDGYGLFPNISLRGVTTERSKAVTIMEDGLLAAPAPYSAPSAYYSPNVGRMSGLEILKGSSQVKYGPHTTGGAVNYLSTPIPAKNETYIKLSYGSDNDVIAHLWHGNTVATEKAGNFGYLIEGYLHHNDGFRYIDPAPDFQQVDQTGFLRLEPMGKFFWELPFETYHRIELKYGHTDMVADETYLGLHPTDFRQDASKRYNSSRFDKIETTARRASARHIMKPTENLRVATTAYYQYFKRDWFKLHQLRGPNVDLSTALLDTTPGGGLAILKGQAAGTLRVRHNNREYNQYGIQNETTYNFEVGPTEQELMAGIRYHIDEVDRFQWDVDYTQAANGSITGATTGAMGAAGDRGQESRAIALFLQDEIKYEKLTFTPGLRYEIIDQSYVQDSRRQDGGGAAASGEGQINALAGGASVSYTIKDNWNAFAGVFRGFSIPGPRSSIRATPNLDEETSLSIEIGTRYNNRKGLLAELVLYRTAFKDLVVGGNVGGGGAATTENVGNVNSIGAEILIGYDAGRANDWVVNVPATLAVTLTDAQLDGPARNTDPESIFEGGRDGSKVPYIPEYQINGEIGVEYAKAGLYFNGTYVPQTYTTAGNTRDPIRSDGVGGTVADIRVGKTDNYFILDMIARYQLNENTTVFAGLKNLLNREYIATRHPIGPRTGLPRNFNLGVEMRF